MLMCILRTFLDVGRVPGVEGPCPNHFKLGFQFSPLFAFHG